MRKHFKKYFIPHHENEYRPHILRETALLALTLVALAIFVFASIHTVVLLNDTDFLAAVLPNVLVDLTNENRTENSISQLTTNPTLEAAAQLKADHMAEHGYFAHVSPDGTTPWHWFIEAGYSFAAAGENLAVNFSDSANVVNAWMDSEGHRENILNSGFTEIGIATSEGTYKGTDTVYIVQLFGTPAIQEETAIPENVASTPSEEIPTEEQAPTVAAETVETPETSTEVTTTTQTQEDIVETQDTLEVIHEDDMFIAVRDTSAETEELAGAEAAGLLAPEQSTFMQRLFAQPRTVAQTLYIILGVFILIALIIGIVIEIKKQHPLHIIYGVLMLLLVLALAYIYQDLIFTELLIL